MPPEDELRRVLHDTLRDHVHSIASGFSTEETNVRRRLRELVAEARRRGIHVEHLIMAIKEAWYALTASHEVVRGSLGRELRSQVVTVAVDEYYQADEQKASNV